MSDKLQLVVDLDKNRPKMNTDQKSKKIGPPYGHVSSLRSSSFPMADFSDRNDKLKHIGHHVV